MNLKEALEKAGYKHSKTKEKRYETGDNSGNYDSSSHHHEPVNNAPVKRPARKTYIRS